MSAPQGPKAAAQAQKCQQCGTCCRNGGPALHRQDLKLISEGTLKADDLITIRAGETVMMPLTEDPKILERELLKIKGSAGSWTCHFLNQLDNTCSIYEHRPLECRRLQCWAPEDLLALINTDNLARADILAPDDPFRQLIDQHEQECPGLKIKEIIQAILSGRDRDKKILADLEDLVNRDLAIRTKAAQEFELSLAMELFLLGRPLFTILQLHGFKVSEAIDTLHLQGPDM